MITVKQDAHDEWVNNNGSNAQLHVGDKIKLKDLLYALLLPSGDDAAIVIADGISGNSDNFVNVMNIFAYRLHLFQTHYINPDGLTYKTGQNYTTTYDLIRLAQYAMSLPLFAQIVKTPQYTLPATGTHHPYIWNTTNAFLAHSDITPTVKPYPGTTGIKTGYTAEAGGCLVFSATRNGHHLIGIVLGSVDETSRFADAATLLNWGFGLPLKVPSP